MYASHGRRSLASAQAYIPHYDWQPVQPGVPFDFDASRDGGSNRFATLFLYLSDVEKGGETVFLDGRPLPDQPLRGASAADALAAVRERGLIDGLEPGSWQEEMVVQCQTRLAVRPRQGEALLFYSQLPSGHVDRRSKHGGCPVLEGTKWAANLWV